MKIKISFDFSKFVCAIIVLSLGKWGLIKPNDIEESLFGLVQLSLWTIGAVLIAFAFSIKLESKDGK